MKALYSKLIALKRILRSPRININLMAEEAENNDPFYTRITEEFFVNSNKGHSRLPLVPSYKYGIAMCKLPASFDDYWMKIEASARRNCKKAVRLHYKFKRIDFNDHIGDIREVRASTDTRQGRDIPESWKNVQPCTDPPSLNSFHDYAWYGIFLGDKLVAYASCFVCGEVAMLQHILGHAAHLSNGIIPMLIVNMAQTFFSDYPCVKYYNYGTFFGASPAMQRFKTKFLFLPHTVHWVPRSSEGFLPTGGSQRKQLVFYMQRHEPFKEGRSDLEFHAIRRAIDVFVANPRPVTGLVENIKLLLKVVSRKRALFYASKNGEVLHTAWASFGFCRHYSVRSIDTVIGPIETSPSGRNQGAATFVLKKALTSLMSEQKHSFYIDTSENNIACLRVVEKCGFGNPKDHFVKARN